MVIGSVMLMILIKQIFKVDKVPMVLAYGDMVPAVVKIERLKISQDIVPGIISGNDWQINEEKVNYLVGSGTLSQENIVLYAHKKWGLFGNLRKIKIGDEIELYSVNEISKYEVVEARQVKASDVSILQGNGEARVTLFTCDGPFDLWRWVVVGRKS